MSAKIRVCHICSYYENILFDNLVFAQEGFTEPSVFFFKKKGNGVQYNKDKINEVECYGNLDRVFFFQKARKVFREYEKLYQNEGFDLLFGHSLFANGYIAYLAHRKYGIPYIVMVQNTDMNVFYKLKPYLSGIALRILLKASRVIFASPSYRDALIERHVPRKYKSDIEKKSILIPYGIDDFYYENKPKNLRKIGNHVRILCAGLICRNKNQLNLAEAITRLNRKGYSIDFIIIGKSGNDRIVSKLKQYEFVTILPFMEKNELIMEYRKSDIFAMVSLTETFGLVYAEALSQGLPIVYSRGQGFDGQFTEGLVGFSADASSVQSISDALENTIQKHDNMQKNTLIASEKFRWSILSQQYQQMYRDIIEDRKL